MSMMMMMMMMIRVSVCDSLPDWQLVPQYRSVQRHR